MFVASRWQHLGVWKLYPQLLQRTEQNLRQLVYTVWCRCVASLVWLHDFISSRLSLYWILVLLMYII